MRNPILVRGSVRLQRSLNIGITSCEPSRSTRLVGSSSGENWNEPQSPDLQFYCGDIPTMVELQKRAYEILKTIDPGAMVTTPAAVGGYGPRWMARFLAAGGGQYADIMAFHGYLAPGASADSVLETITNFRTVFATYGQDKKPVWDTEAGWGENSWLPDPAQQAAFLAEFYLLHWSAGVERLYWYAYNEPKWGTLWDASNGLHEAGVAYREVQRWLQGATMTTPCKLSRTMWTCNLVREDHYRGIVVWSSRSEAANVPFFSVPSDFQQYRDLKGNVHNVLGDSVPVSAAPILVETQPAF